MDQLRDWLVLFALILAVPLLARPFIRRQLSRLGGVVFDRLSQPAEPDREAEELWSVLRRERLCADLRRVEHLIATDTWMSATRQLGNRLAYAQLLDDLKHTPEVLPALSGFGEVDSWTAFPPAVEQAFPSAGYAPRNAPKIEILEIGWRR
jgi:hypothetical protein